MGKRVEKKEKKVWVLLRGDFGWESTPDIAGIFATKAALEKYVRSDEDWYNSTWWAIPAIPSNSSDDDGLGEWRNQEFYEDEEGDFYDNPFEYAKGEREQLQLEERQKRKAEQWAKAQAEQMKRIALSSMLRGGSF